VEIRDYINCWESNKEIGLAEVKEKFLKLFPKAEFLPSIYHPILYKFLKNDQIKHWDNNIFSFSKNKIEELESIANK